MSFMLRRVYKGLLFHPDAFHIHPLVGTIILMVQLLLLIWSNFIILTSLLSLVILENILFKNSRGSISLIRALFPILIILTCLTFIFGGPEIAALVLLRFLIGALSCSLYFTITNPSDLTRVLEQLKIPIKWAILPSLMLTMVPRIAKDAEETFDTLALRGEMQGFFIKWLPKALAIFIASTLYRSEFLAQSLYYRGLGIKKRTHYRNVSIQKADFLRLFIWLIIGFTFLGISL